MWKFILGLSLAAGSLSASSMYTVTGSDTDGNVDAQATFTISNGDLFVALTTEEADPMAAGQLISDFSFVLQNGTTVLTSPGTLSTKITNDGGANPANDGVTVLDSNFNATTTNTLPARWLLTYESSKDIAVCDTVGFCLNALSGTSPEYMIIGPGPYTNANSSITGHAPSLAGQVVFEIDNIPGLTSTTTVSSAVFSFGTGADAFLPGTCVSGCSTGPGGGPTIPEPLSFCLVGGGLLGLGLFRRFRA